MGRAFFEEVICEELSHYLFRQIRGELKSGYVSLTRSMRGIRESIVALNEAVAQYAKEIIANNCMPQWGLYVVADKICTEWGNPLCMQYYKGVNALASDYSLAQVAMVDAVSLDRRFASRVGVEFYKDHPRNSMKRNVFRSKTG